MVVADATEGTAVRTDEFRHDALLYRDDGEFLDGTTGFVLDGLAEGAPVLVALGADRTRLLQGALGGAAAQVEFVAMEDLGANPARIIPAWADFVDRHRHAAAPPRGIAEPAWPGRDAAEMAECRRHEELLNLAFAGGRPWLLRCPYDVARLDDDVVAGARCTHPELRHGPGTSGSADYRRPADWCTLPLPDPPPGARHLGFRRRSTAALRDRVARAAAAAGLGPDRSDDLVIAVNELMENSLRHGGGGGRLTVWQDRSHLWCQVADGGTVTDPLAGRVFPDPGAEGGRGLWMVNQLCDLVQLRTSGTGTVVRVRMARR